MPSAVIIGGGWAGLSCAWHLVNHGWFIQVLEASAFLGGRARTVQYNNHIIDNGQHILIGACTELAAMYQQLHLNINDYIKHQPINYHIANYPTSAFKLRSAWLPWSINKIISLCTAKFSWQDKLAIATIIQRISRPLNLDKPVLTWLTDNNQSTALINNLWEPLLVAATTTPLQHASTLVCVNILQELLASHKTCQWWLPKVNLNQLLPEHLHAAIKQQGGQIYTRQRATKLISNNSLCTHVLSKDYSLQADQVVLATQAWQASRLLADNPLCHDLCDNLNSFTYQAITTIYFYYSCSAKLINPIMLAPNSIMQWIFCGSLTKDYNSVRAILNQTISATLTKQQIIQRATIEIMQLLPNLGRPRESFIVNEQRGAFACTPEIQCKRPLATIPTPLKNVWLTADYCQTNLPSCLEGALRSGKATALAIIKSQT